MKYLNLLAVCFGFNVEKQISLTQVSAEHVAPCPDCPIEIPCSPCGFDKLNCCWIKDLTKDTKGIMDCIQYCPSHV